MICGIETEFGLHTKDDGLSERLVKYALGGCVYNATYNGGFHLATGGRIYVDTGCHPEYATPECLSAREAVLHLKAGVQIMQNALEVSVNKRYDNAAKLFMNNVSYNKSSYGCHENYMISSKLFNEICMRSSEKRGIFLAFLMTRQIMTGAGYWGFGKLSDTLIFRISQRSLFFQSTVGSSTTVGRSIINTRDETHCQDGFSRLHLIIGDSNMSEFANWLKVGVTMVMLDILDMDVDVRWAVPVFYGDVIKGNVLDRISLDFSLQEKFYTDWGMASALFMQRQFLALAKKHITPAMGEKWQIVKAWEFVLDALERDRWSLIGYLDWVTKLYFSAKYAKKELNVNVPLEKNRVILNSADCYEEDMEKIRGFCVGYHDLSDRGIFSILTKSGCVKRILTDGQIKEAATNPPKTRAMWRTTIMKILLARGVDYLIDWASIISTGGNLRQSEHKFFNFNPYSCYDKIDFHIARSL